MAAPGARVLRSQASKEKRRDEDEEASGGDEEASARREAARRRKKRRDDGLEDDNAERKDDGCKLEEIKETTTTTTTPRPQSEDGLVEILEPLFLLRNNLANILNNPKPKQQVEVPHTPAPALLSQQWGVLVSQYPPQSTVPLTGTVFAIGRSSKCNLQLRESSISSLLCNLVWQDGSALIECCSSSGILSLNDRPMRKGARMSLKSGDQISISGLKPYLFSYQLLPTPQLVNTPAQAVAPPGSPPSQGNFSSSASNSNSSMSQVIAPPPSSSTTSLAAAIANAASSLPLPPPQLPPPPPQVVGPHPEPPADPATAKNRKRWGMFSDSNSDGEALADNNETFSIRDSSSGIKLARNTSATSWPNLPPASSSATLLAAAIANAAPPAAPPPAVVAPPAAAPSPAPAALPTNMETANKMAAPTSSNGSVSNANNAAKDAAKETAKEEFLRSIVAAKNIAVSFEKFPYYLSDDVKRHLINCVYVYLLRPELGKFTAELPTVSRRILLSGPAGTEMYQETLARALANHFQCNLLVFDPTKIAPLDSNDSGRAIPGASAVAAEPRSIQTAAGLTRHTDNIDETDADLWQLDGRRPFRKGDKVRFVGAGFSSSVTGIFRQLHTVPDRREPRGPQAGAKGKVMITFDDSNRRVGVRFEKPVPGGNSLGGLCEESHGFFTEASELRHDAESGDTPDSVQLEALFEAVSETQPCILFLRDADKCIAQSYDRYAVFRRLLERINGHVVVIGSSVVSDGTRRDKNVSPGLVVSKGSGVHTTLLDFSFIDHVSRLEERVNRESSKQARILARVLPTKVTIAAPVDAAELGRWKKQIEKDVEALKLETNHLLIRRVLERNAIDAPSLPENKFLKEQVLPLESVEKIVGYAVSHHAMSSEIADVRGDRLCLSLESLSCGVEMQSTAQAEPMHQRVLRDIETENEFEKRLLADVVPPSEIGVRFEDIGALDSVKETLRELVMLPLQRPELFRKGALTRPCKGILMFGPPGTGKTMLARAVATESGANFINLSMSSIASKWFGEGEKFARAVFTLASKIAPAVIFIDEVDSILGKRERHGEHEAMRKIKNEFMSMWDGLKTKENERVLVLAATNRPFDLDDAVLRRMPRRLLVDLPDALLAKEELADGFDFAAVAQSTEGYSGSDLKSLCVAAAYIPIREILDKEKKENVREAEPFIRQLTLEDFKRAKNDICASVSEDAFSIGELRKWNEMYGEGGKRGAHSRLSYFM